MTNEIKQPEPRPAQYNYDLMRVVSYNPDGSIIQRRDGKPAARDGKVKL